MENLPQPMSPDKKSRYRNQINLLNVRRNYWVSLYNNAKNPTQKIEDWIWYYNFKIKAILDLLNGKNDEQGDSDSDRVQS